MKLLFNFEFFSPNFVEFKHAYTVSFDTQFSTANIVISTKNVASKVNQLYLSTAFITRLQ